MLGRLARAAIEIADMFLDEGSIVTTRGRAYEDQTYYATSQTLAPDMPLLIMINRRSASASEVLSGALADHDRAVVLGERSFGKGLVQDIRQLPSGAGQLKITEQRYYGPSDKLIQREDDSAAWGVDPSNGFFVTMTNREISRALRTRAQDSVIRPGDGSTPRPAAGEAAESWVRERYGDEPLARAIEAVRTRLNTGDWAPVSDAGDAAAPARQELLYAVRARDYLLRELERANERIGALATVASEEEADALSLLPDDVELEGGLIEIRDGLAVIDYERIEFENPAAVERCPTGAIVWLEGRQFADLDPARVSFNAFMTATSRGLLHPDSEGNIRPTTPMTGADAILALRTLSGRELVPAK